MNTLVTSAASFSPVADFSEYLRAVFRFPELNPAEEPELAIQLRRNNDSKAAWRLVTSHLRYVVFISRSYLGYGLPQEDMIQVGNVGLREAVKRFDPDQGVPLRSYAAYSIRHHIHEFIIRNWRMVKVATTKARRKLFFKLRSTKKALEWLNHREAVEVANKLEVNVEDVQHMETSMYLKDKPIGPLTCEESYGAIPVDCQSNRDYDPGRLVEFQDLRDKTQVLIDEGLALMDERSRRILEARWLCDKKLTLEALAMEFGISIERVR